MSQDGELSGPLYSSFSEVGVGIAEYSVRARVLNFDDVGVAAPFADALSLILRSSF